MSEKEVWKAFRGQRARKGWHCSMGRLQGNTLPIKGFNGQDIMLAVEKAQVMAFAPRGVSLGSEGKLLWL